MYVLECVLFEKKKQRKKVRLNELKLNDKKNIIDIQSNNEYKEIVINSINYFMKTGNIHTNLSKYYLFHKISFTQYLLPIIVSQVLSMQQQKRGFIYFITHKIYIQSEQMLHYSLKN